MLQKWEEETYFTFLRELTVYFSCFAALSRAPCGGCRRLFAGLAQSQRCVCVRVTELTEGCNIPEQQKGVAGASPPSLDAACGPSPSPQQAFPSICTLSKKRRLQFFFFFFYGSSLGLNKGAFVPTAVCVFWDNWFK